MQVDPTVWLEIPIRALELTQLWANPVNSRLAATRQSAARDGRRGEQDDNRLRLVRGGPAAVVAVAVGGKVIKY